MYKRVLQINPSHPAEKLAQLYVGAYSAMLLVVRGVPDTVDSGTWTYRPDDGSDGVAFPIEKDADSGIWSVKVRDGFFTDLGINHYDVELDVDGRLYYSGSGIIETVSANISSFSIDAWQKAMDAEVAQAKEYAEEARGYAEVLKNNPTIAIVDNGDGTLSAVTGVSSDALADRLKGITTDNVSLNGLLNALKG